jgi:hypothetical protein
MKNRFLVPVICFVILTGACNANRHTAHVEGWVNDSDITEVPTPLECDTTTMTVSYIDATGRGTVVAEVNVTNQRGDLAEYVSTLESGNAHSFEFTLSEEEQMLESFEFIMTDETDLREGARLTFRIDWPVDPVQSDRLCGLIGFGRVISELSTPDGETTVLSWQDDWVDESPERPRSYRQHSIDLEPGELVRFIVDRDQD